MPNIARLYFVALIASALIALILMTPHIFLFVALVTMGLGAPLVFAPTVFIYLAALSPVALAGSKKSAVIALPASALLCAAWAFVPYIMSYQQAAPVAAQLTVGDFSPPTMTAARTLEIRRPSTFSHKLGSWLPSEPCPSSCRALLLGGEVDWIRVVMKEKVLNRGKVKENLRATRYETARGKACETGTGEGSPTICVVFAADKAEAASLVVEISESDRIDRLVLKGRPLFEGNTQSGAPTPTPRRQASAGRLLFEVGGERVVTATSIVEATQRVVMRHTEVQLSPIMPGSFLVAANLPPDPRPIRFIQKPVRFNGLEFDSVLRRLGYRLDVRSETPAVDPDRKQWRDPPEAEMTIAIQSLLDRPASLGYTVEEKQAIQSWISHARSYREWPPGRVLLLKRIFEDPRVKDLFQFDQILIRNRAVAEALLPSILKRLAKINDADGDDVALSAARTFGRIDPVLLRPYSSEIANIVARGGYAGQAASAGIGRIGLNPLPYLKLMLKKDGTIDESKVRAACLASDEWSALLIPPLRAILTDQVLARYRNGRSAEGVFKALLRHGDEAYAREAFAKTPDGHRLRRLEGWKTNFQRQGSDAC